MLKSRVRSDCQSLQVPATRWGHRRRLEFIDFRLLWDGRLNRKELVAFFGISIQQASLDLARYIKIAPKNLRYDSSEKVYRATVHFKPAFLPADSDVFLSQLLALAEGTLPASASFVGWQPPYDVVRFPSRSIHPDVLARVVQGIRNGEDIEVTYQSMRQPSLSRRWIAPHAIAFDGARWHARGWCHEHADFRDFVLARIQQVHGGRPSAIDPNSDARWHSHTTVILRPRRSLTRQQRAAVEAEFAMTHGRLKVEVREALVFYFVRQLQLETAPAIRIHPIEWVNEEDLRPLLVEAARR
jgi:hypothetical protein